MIGEVFSFKSAPTFAGMLIAGQLVSAIACTLVSSLSILAHVLTAGVIVNTLINVYITYYDCTPMIVSINFPTFTVFAIVDKEETRAT